MGMTLDEAILHAKEVAEEQEKASKEWQECKNRGNVGWSKSDIESVDGSFVKCNQCAAEHRQLMAWLKDYKRLKEQEKTETVSIEAFEQIKWERDIAIQQLNELGYGLGEKIRTDDDAIRRQAVLDLAEKGVLVSNGNYKSVCKAINELPPVNPQPKTWHCKDCIYFEYDSVARVDGIPLIVAHEICSKWGDGCKTSEDGYCFLFEPQESEGEDKEYADCIDAFKKYALGRK